MSPCSPPLPARLRAAFIEHGRVQQFEAGRVIANVGDQDTSVILIEAGEVRVTLYSDDGREVSVRTLTAGDLFGDLAAIDGGARSAAGVAITDVICRVIPQQTFLGAIDVGTEERDWFNRRLVSEVRRLTERVFELSALSVRARLHCELLRLAKEHDGPRRIIRSLPTHSELAARIGATREAVTRELSALEARRLIRRDRRRMTLLDLDALS
jgi:CRP/FNR family transcriptional regulator, cyclic AMP receptor protein